MNYLVNDPAAVDFLDLANVPSGLNAHLGDPDNTDPMLGADIKGAQIELQYAVKKLQGLTVDPTRTEVDRHIAAKKLATKVIDRLAATKTAIEARAKELESSSLREADSVLGPRADKAGLHSEIRDYLIEVNRKSDGLEKTRAALAESPEVAAVLWHSPRFLTGLPGESHDLMRIEALKSARPDLHTNLSNAIGLTNLAAKYKTAIGKVSRSFYNEQMASQAKRRVEV
jgi:hypothetical protein